MMSSETKIRELERERRGMEGNGERERGDRPDRERENKGEYMCVFIYCTFVLE